jgi:uncharacterized SAM-binding protein YcdF (DUF218 family)
MISLAATLAPNILLWLCLGLGWALWRGRRRAPQGDWLAPALLLCLWLLSTRPVAEKLMAPLEGSYVQTPVSRLVDRGVHQVVVLTAGGFSDETPLLSSSLTPSSTYRLLAGLELCSQLGPDCSVLISGSAGRANRNVAAAEGMKKLAQRIAPLGEYAAESDSGSTAEHPVNVAPLLQEGPFALVTSGFHMPRAMRSFERHQLEAIPYPADLLVRGNYRWNDWLPSGQSLALTSIAFREYLALFLYFLRGW